MSSKKGFSPSLDPELNREIFDAGKMLCYDSFDSACTFDHTANLTHIPCLQLAVGKFPWITTSSLCQLSKVLQPIIGWNNAVNILNTKPSVSVLPRLRTNPVVLSLLLHELHERLPIEVLTLICAMISDGLFALLARCYETLR